MGVGLCLNPHPQFALGTEGRRLGTYKIATSAPCEPPRATLSGWGAESLGRGWHGEVTPKVPKLVVMGRSGLKRSPPPLPRTSRPTRSSQSLLVQSSRPDLPLRAPGPGRRRSPSIEAPMAPAHCSRLRLWLRFPRPGTERLPPGTAGVAGGGEALGPGHPGGGGCRWAERCSWPRRPPCAPPPLRPCSAPAAQLAVLGRPGAGGRTRAHASAGASAPPPGRAPPSWPRRTGPPLPAAT